MLLLKKSLINIAIFNEINLINIKNYTKTNI